MTTSRKMDIKLMQRGITQSEVITRYVLELIENHRLQPGASLPSEIAIAAETGVSRGIVREAIRGLAHLGVVNVANGRKPRVGKLNGNVLSLLIEYAVKIEQITVLQTLDVRRALEVRSAQLAALHRTDREAEEILQAAQKMKSSLGDHDLMTRHDINFHILIATASRNSLLRLEIEGFKYVMESTAPIGWKSRSDYNDVLNQVAVHLDIAEAIKNRDPEKASDLMKKHFNDTSTVLSNVGFN